MTHARAKRFIVGAGCVKHQQAAGNNRIIDKQAQDYNIRRPLSGCLGRGGSRFWPCAKTECLNNISQSVTNDSCEHAVAALLLIAIRRGGDCRQPGATFFANCVGDHANLTVVDGGTGATADSILAGAKVRWRSRLGAGACAPLPAPGRSRPPWLSYETSPYGRHSSPSVATRWRRGRAGKPSYHTVEP